MLSEPPHREPLSPWEKKSRKNLFYMFSHASFCRCHEGRINAINAVSKGNFQLELSAAFHYQLIKCKQHAQQEYDKSFKLFFCLKTTFVCKCCSLKHKRPPKTDLLVRTKVRKALTVIDTTNIHRHVLFRSSILSYLSGRQGANPLMGKQPQALFTVSAAPQHDKKRPVSAFLSKKSLFRLV